MDEASILLEVEFSSQRDFAYKFFSSDLQAEGAPRDLELAYAVTVHKAQGSEFGTCFVVLPKESRILSRELIYTALTRQQQADSHPAPGRPCRASSASRATISRRRSGG